MRGQGRLLGIAAVFVMATLGWLALSGITHVRMGNQSEKLRSSVQNLWGNQQSQRAPVLTFHYETEELTERIESKNGVEVKVKEMVLVKHERPVSLASTDVDVRLGSDLRRKGLMWYSLYNVQFQGGFSYVHDGPERGELEVMLAFPDPSALYDDFRFSIDGVDVVGGLDPNGDKLRARIRVEPGQRVQIHAGYKSRGLDQWQYRPAEGVGRLEDFALTMHTDFTDIDYPSGTLSPSSRTAEGSGYKLDWKFKQIVTGNGIGMVTPSRIQPGELSAQLSLSAPVSLFFYFFVIFVLATLRGIELHPINYLLIAGAFFAFHLLFAYSVDHLPVEAAFALCSVVSVFLVVSYLRLVVSARFAYVEAGAAQLIYLVGFSLAHFWEGFTGLTATLLAIATLFLLMQLTGRVRWSDALSGKPAPAIAT
jgi:inner membrane protein involved in colicin E2 resistance